MTKKKKIIILVLGISIALVGVLALVFNKDLINKLRSSVIDPTTGDVCTEDAKSTNIIHENGETVKKILDDLYAEKDSTCSTGYSCHKPAIPTKVEPESCFTLDSSHIMYSINDEEITVENAIKELYTIYNSASFCPQKYCEPNTYTVNLDKNGGTSQGTDKIYEKFDTAVYLDSTENNEMTASTNPITIPQKVYTITYEANGQGASYTGSPTTSSATFNGYFTEASGGTKMIDENGYIIPSNFPNNKYSDEATLYAQYSNTAITLPAITKANATCKWAEGSASGTQYAGGTSRTISGNTKYYAVCVANPIITVINNRCDENGNNCTQASKVTYQKAPGTTETISATAQSGYNNPGSYSVTYNANHTLTFNHTKILTLNTSHTPYSSSQLRAARSGSTTEIYQASNSRSYLYIVPAIPEIGIKYYDRTSGGSTSFSGYPYLYKVPDSDFGGSNYGNGSHGTYYVRTCNANAGDNTESCTDAEELRPYFEIKYDLRGGSGTSSNQSKYVNQSITLHGAPSRSGYTFRGWAAQTQGGEQCQNEYRDYYVAAGTPLGPQDWNVGNETWPCPTKEAYVGGTNIVWLRAVWNRNAWTTYN